MTPERALGASLLAVSLLSTPAARSQTAPAPPPAAASPSAHAAGAAAGTAEDDRARAKRLAEKGQDLFQAQDYEGALVLFQQAESAFHAPTLLLLIARTRVQLGEVVQAARVYDRIVAEQLPADAPEAWRAAQQLARTEVPDVRKRLAVIEIVVPRAAAGMVLSIGGERVTTGIVGPHEIDPGKPIDLSLSAPGHAPARARVRVEAGRREEVALELSPSGSPVQSVAASPAPTLVSLGIAALGLGVGVGAGIAALDRTAELDDRCVDKRCNQSDRDLQSAAGTLADVSTIGFVAAAAGLAVGATFFVLSRGGKAWTSSASAKGGGRHTQRIEPHGIGGRF